MNRQQRRQQKKRDESTAPAISVSVQEKLETGIKYFHDQQYIKAENTFKKAAAQNPVHAHTFFLLGMTLNALGKFDEAIGEFSSAAKLDPKNEMYLNTLAKAYKDQNRNSEAITAFQDSIKQKPDDYRSHYGLADTLYQMGKFEMAIIQYKQVLNLKPDFRNAWFDQAMAFQILDRYEDSQTSVHKALELEPENAASLHLIGRNLMFLGDVDNAIAHTRKAIELDSQSPFFRLDLAFQLLAAGKTQEGLDMYEHRWESLGSRFASHARSFSQPKWDGKLDLSDKTILIWREQGIADVMLTLSQVSNVISQARHCIIECQPRLISLLQRSFPDAEIRAEDTRNDAKRTDIDCHLPTGSLFHRLQPDINKGTAPKPYLAPDPEQLGFWKSRLDNLGPGTKVGISWSSPHVTTERAPHYTKLSQWVPILNTPGVQFINLQCQNYEPDLTWALQNQGVQIHDFKDLDLYEDIEGITALTASLDLVISVATAVSTIAVGVGTPNWELTWRQSTWSNMIHCPSGPGTSRFYRNTNETWQNAIFDAAEQLLEFNPKA